MPMLWKTSSGIAFLCLGSSLLFAGCGQSAPLSQVENTSAAAPLEQTLSLAKGPDGASYVPGQLLIGYRNGPRDERETFRRAHGLTLVRAYGPEGAELVRLPAGADTLTTLSRLQGDSRLRYAELDGIYQPDIYANDLNENQWSLNNTGQRGGVKDADVDGPEAWDDLRDCSRIVVAVVDTGIDLNHEDLVGNLWLNHGEIPDNGIDDDHNGFVDDVRGWNFQKENNIPADDSGHGTHISGIIGAVGNNGLGVAGMCWSVQIMPVKAMSRLYGTTSDVVAALNYAIDNGADVVNASFSGRRDSRTMREAIKHAEEEGVLVAAAAGNDTNNNDATPYYPSSYGNSNVVGVAATTRMDVLASYSNYGDVSVPLAAPGDEIYSTLPGNSYGLMSGTSMAAPHVAGAAALLLSVDPSLTPDEVRNLLTGGVDQVGILTGIVASGGRLNVHNSLNLLGMSP